MLCSYTVTGYSVTGMGRKVTWGQMVMVMVVVMVVVVVVVVVVEEVSGDGGDKHGKQ